MYMLKPREENNNPLLDFKLRWGRWFETTNLLHKEINILENLNKIIARLLPPQNNAISASADNFKLILRIINNL